MIVGANLAIFIAHSKGLIWSAKTRFVWEKCLSNDEAVKKVAIFVYRFPFIFLIIMPQIKVS